MRVMVFVKATEDSERGLPPAAEMTAMFEAMGKFNEELVKAGVMIDGDGLKPSSAGKRIAFDGAKRTVIDSPFAEARELVAGYWVWEVKSMDEAIAWAKRSPNPMPGPSELEIRPFYEMEDFGDAVTPEVAEREQRLRDQLGGDLGRFRRRVACASPAAGRHGSERQHIELSKEPCHGRDVDHRDVRPGSRVAARVRARRA